MNKFVQLLIPRRIVVQRILCYRSCVDVNKSISQRSLQLKVTVSSMSQRSITSFFKATPKKSDSSDDKTADKSIEEDVKSEEPSKVPTPPKPTKRSSKRLRSSSAEESSPVKEKSASPVTPASKKKVKRQRIESSGSEADLPNSPEFNGDSCRQEPENKPVKTYDSPKTKKSKIKKEKPPLVEKNGVKEENSPPQKSKAKKDTTPKQSKIVSVKKEKCTPAKRSKSPEEKLKNGDDKKEEETESTKVPEHEYNPAKAKYHPIKDACWSKGQEVPYLALAKTFEAIEAISARLKIVEILSNYFRSVILLTPDDLLPSIYMCLNQLAPAYHSLELGIAETYLMKAVGQCTGRSISQVRAASLKAGDLGAAAQAARAAQTVMFPAPELSVRKVFRALKEVANMTGQASVNKKISKIQSLFIACRHSEAKYLIRSLEGKLRIGLAEQSVLQALAQAAATTPPPVSEDMEVDASRGIAPEVFKAKIDSVALTIKSTYCECPNYDLLIPVLLQEGVAMLPQRVSLTPGIPLKPMLAHPTKGVHEVFNRFENERFTCEYKYDGERAQIHVPAASDGGPDLMRASVYSRNQENNTTKYPDILKRLPSLLSPSVHSCVLDCEAVAYDTVNKQILPFQVLSTRKRKDASSSDIAVQVCVFVFDVLFLNGRSLAGDELVERRNLLREHFHAVPGEWEFARSKDCSSAEEVQAFLEDAVRDSCEGLMVKTLEGNNSRYDIARRSHNWLKLKKDYLDGVGDTVDAVIIGGYFGKGKRSGVFGGFLLACYDPDAEEYQSLCKLGTGFSDDDLTTISARLREIAIDAPRNYYRFDPSHAPDAWFPPSLVAELRAADLSLSPAHRAACGLVEGGKGVSLRFPRFLRLREDKTPEQATSARQIADMYLAQDQVKNTKNCKQSSHDDFY